MVNIRQWQVASGREQSQTVQVQNPTSRLMKASFLAGSRDKSAKTSEK